MKILNSTTINGNMSKLLETPDYFIINGQIYDKGTLSPLPLSFCPVNVSVNNEMILNQTAYVNSQWYLNHSNCQYILDSNDSNVSYVVVEGLAANNQCALVRLTKKPDGSIATTPCNLGNTYYCFVDILGQDAQKIYIMFYQSYGGYYSYIGYIDKTTLAWTNLNLNCGNYKVLKMTDMYIYYAAQSVGTLNLQIMKYNKTNNTNTILYTDVKSGSTGYNFQTVVSDMDSNGVFYIKDDGKWFGMADHYMTIRKFILDTSKDTVVASVVNLDNSKWPNPQIMINVINAGFQNTNYMLNITDPNTSKKYIAILTYNGGNQNIYLNPIDSQILVYEVTDPDNFKLVSWNSFNPIIYKTFLSINNNQTLLLAFENGVHIYTWNSGTTSFQKVSGMDNPMAAVGVDNNNNIYIQNKDTSIDMISNVMPINVYCDFEKDEYPYNSVNIDTNVILYVQNYQNKYLSSSVQLTLYGNCKFTSNNSRTITVTTSNLDKLSVPVSITGEGNLEVVYKIL
jgi:hypothetical protein